MPGTPATSPRVGAPRYAQSDPATFSSQVNAITDSFDAAVARLVDVDLAAGTGSLRTLGTGPLQAVAGNDTRLSDARTPTDASVNTAKLIDAAVTTAKLVDASVTTAKLADSSVTSAKIADGTITNVDVDAAAAIDLVKLAAGACSIVGMQTTSDQTQVDANQTHAYTNITCGALPYASKLVTVSVQSGVDNRGGGGAAFPGHSVNGVTALSATFDISGGAAGTAAIVQEFAGPYAKASTPTVAFVVQIANQPVRWVPRGTAMTLVFAVKL